MIEVQPNGHAPARGHVAPQPSSVHVLPPTVIELIDRAWSRDLPAHLATGLVALDDVLGGGLPPESLTVVNASTGKGKTGLAAQLSRHAARDRGVLYLSLELSERQMLARLVGQACGVPWRDVFKWPQSRKPDIAAALTGLERLRIREWSPLEWIEDDVKAIADRDGVAPLVVVDYLHIMARRVVVETRADIRQATSTVADFLHRVARDEGATVLALSSVGRAFYKTSDRSTSDLLGASKESGDIEFGAGAVLFLEVDDKSEGGDGRAARLHVSKNRFGEDGKIIGLRFFGAVGMFTPDDRAALRPDEVAILDAVAAGATSTLEVAKELGKAKQTVCNLVAGLKSRGYLEPKGRGLRLPEAGQ